MSDLRDRIAAVLHNAFDGKFYGHLPDHVFLDQADALIAELGLTRVTRSERVPIHRYVTNWQGSDNAD